MVLLIQIPVIPSHRAKTEYPEWEIGAEDVCNSLQLKEMRKRIACVKPQDQNSGHNMSWSCNIL